MVLAINLTPTEQARIVDAARQKGLEPAEYAKRLLTENLPEVTGEEPQTGAAQNAIDRSHFYFTATREEFNAALDEIARMNISLPVLSKAAFDRENLYQAHGVTHLLTMNPTHFRRFAGISVVEPKDVPGVTLP